MTACCIGEGVEGETLGVPRDQSNHTAASSSSSSVSSSTDSATDDDDDDDDNSLMVSQELQPGFSSNKDVRGVDGGQRNSDLRSEVSRQLDAATDSNGFGHPGGRLV